MQQSYGKTREMQKESLLLFSFPSDSNSDKVKYTKKNVMQALNLPKTDLRITTKDGKQQVFDILRRKYVALTPEEWVRQQFVHYLILCKGYPAECIGNEISLTLNGTRKRCDSVVYGQNAQPIMIIEYKSPQVDITQNVFEQISRYNIRLKVQWLVVSNGLQHYCCRIDYESGTCQFAEDIPPYATIRG